MLEANRYFLNWDIYFIEFYFVFAPQKYKVWKFFISSIRNVRDLLGIPSYGTIMLQAFLQQTFQ